MTDHKLFINYINTYRFVTNKISLPQSSNISFSYCTYAGTECLRHNKCNFVEVTGRLTSFTTAKYKELMDV